MGANRGPARRTFLAMLPSAVAARLLPGCDRLTVLGGDAGDGIAPITSNREFYIYSYSGPPTLDPATHVMAIRDEDALLAEFDLAFLETLPARAKEHTLQCIGSRPTLQNIGNAVWEGLPLVEVLEALGVAVPAGKAGIRMVGMDDYDAGVALEDLEGAPIWLVWRMNGEPLHLLHGAPARLLVPGRYGVKNLKWIRELAFVAERRPSYWTERGWDEAAPYLANTFVASPTDRAEVSVGVLTRVVGTAFKGGDAVESVEYAVDGGEWRPCDLDYATGDPDIWVLWSFVWRPNRAGDYLLQVRCRTVSGDTSSESPDATDRKSGYDGSMAVTVRARA